jgi:hypothetical protein
MVRCSACLPSAYMSENKAPAAQLNCAGAVRLSPPPTKDDREGPAPPWALPAIRHGLAPHPLSTLLFSRGPFQCILEAADGLAFVLGGRPGHWLSAALQCVPEAAHPVGLLLAGDWGYCGLVLP